MSIPNIPFVQISLTLANKAISELKIIRDFEQEDSAKLLEGHLFSLYALSLQYMFLMEITKLLEGSNKGGKENFSSMEKAGEAMLKKGISNYADNHSILKARLENIRESEFFGYLKKLRNKKYAHSDGDLDIDPLKFPIPKSDEILDCLKIMTELYDIWKLITNAIGYDFDSKVPHRDVRTRNYLKFHSVYKQFYFDHKAQAIREGYLLK